MQDKLILGGHEFTSRFILGSGKYNLNLINAAVEEGGAEIITLAVRRACHERSHKRRITRIGNSRQWRDSAGWRAY